MDWRLLFVLAIITQFAACVSSPDSPLAPPPTHAARPLPDARTSGPNGSRTSRTVPHQVARPPTAKPPAKPSADPEELIGLNEAGVRDLLGTPAEARNEGTARIMAYRANGCALDVMLFLDVKAGDMRVLSYQIDGAPRLAASKCYGQLRGAR